MSLSSMKQQVNALLCVHSTVPVLVPSLEPGKISCAKLKRHESTTKKKKILFFNGSSIHLKCIIR